MNDMNNHKEEFDGKKKLQGIKDLGMGLVANITEKVEIWARIIRTRVKISGLKKEIEENKMKIGVFVYRKFSLDDKLEVLDISEDLCTLLQRIKSLYEDIAELEEVVKALEKKRQEMSESPEAEEVQPAQEQNVTVLVEKEKKEDVQKPLQEQESVIEFNKKDVSDDKKETEK